MSFHVPEQYRRAHPCGFPHAYGDLYGWFILPRSLKRAYPLRCMASSGTPQIRWEHVSVSTAVRTPTWEEMCWVKSLFWDPEDVVVQYHPRASNYVNEHEYCLHLWRPLDVVLPEPPTIAVGNK